MAVLKVKQADGSWMEVPALVGPQGETGPQGIQGETGPQGIQGETGPQGEKGDKGDKGEVDYSRLADYLPLSGGTMTGELRVNGGDVAGGSKIVLETNKGQITNSSTQTLFGFTTASTIAVGHSSCILAMRGSGTRPKYNSNELALANDIPTLTTETWICTLEDGSTVVKKVYVE
jgi:hypothetical protein